MRAEGAYRAFKFCEKQRSSLIECRTVLRRSELFSPFIDVTWEFRSGEDAHFSAKFGGSVGGSSFYVWGISAHPFFHVCITPDHPCARLAWLTRCLQEDTGREVHLEGAVLRGFEGVAKRVILVRTLVAHREAIFVCKVLFWGNSPRAAKPGCAKGLLGPFAPQNRPRSPGAVFGPFLAVHRGVRAEVRT